MMHDAGYLIQEFSSPEELSRFIGSPHLARQGEDYIYREIRKYDFNYCCCF